MYFRPRIVLQIFYTTINFLIFFFNLNNFREYLFIHKFQILRISQKLP